MVEELGPLFVNPPETHFLWIVAAATALATTGLALYGLVRGSVRAELLVGGLILLPAFLLVLANLVVLDQSKETEFCGSCHEPMAPVVASLAEDNGSLAAIHYRRGAIKGETACYTCHSGYGLAGDLAAKTAGLGHMWARLTDHYDLPLAMRAPFDIDSCLDCHRGAQSFRDVPSHSDREIQERLMSRELSCTTVCHPAAHPEGARQGTGTRE